MCFLIKKFFIACTLKKLQLPIIQQTLFKIQQTPFKIYCRALSQPLSIFLQFAWLSNKLQSFRVTSLQWR